MWMFEIRDKEGLNPVRLKSAYNFKVSRALNSPGQASFTIDLNDEASIESNLREGRSQLYIYRNKVLYWSGKVMVVDRYFDVSSQRAEVLALGWLWMFEKRFVGKNEDVTYTATDAGQILWDLINDSQFEYGGYIGIEEGTITPSINLTVTYTRQKIKEAIDDLVEQAGIDFEVTPDKALNVYYPKGSDRSSSVILKYPGNIQTLRVVKDATVVANNILGLGRGYGSQELTSQVSDVGSIGVFDLYEDIISFKDIVNQTPLDNMTNHRLRLYKSSRLTIDVTIHGDSSEQVQLDDYNLGDTIRVITDQPNFTLNQTFRIFEISITIGDNGQETVKLILGLV